MKTYQQKYDEAWSAAQAGGMTSGDSHNFAVDQASRPVKEIKHTPESWIHTLPQPGKIGGHEVHSKAGLICMLQHHPAEQEQAGTNARLIAAAPAMAEALRAIVENWSTSTDKQRAIAQKAICCALAIEQAREALKLAGVPAVGEDA